MLLAYAYTGVNVHQPHAPLQVTSATPNFRRKALAWVGRIGWVGKAVVYAMIGGLACQSAAIGRDPTPASDLSVGTQGQINASPQVRARKADMASTAH
jgi:hypothetical protein